MTHEEILQAANAEARALAEAAGIGPIARAIDIVATGPDMLPAFLGHQLVKGHAVMLRLASKIDHYLALIAADRPPDEQDRGSRHAAQLSVASARLLEGYRLGVLSLARLERWNRAARPGPAADLAQFGLPEGFDEEFDKDFDRDFDGDDPDPDGGPKGGPGGGRRSHARLLAQMRAARAAAAQELARFTANGNGVKSNGNGTHLAAKPRSERATPCPASDSEWANTQPPASDSEWTNTQPPASDSEWTNTQLPASDSEWTNNQLPASARRNGRLRHGNPSGDLAAVPRCGAATRAGSGCRQPAMKSPRGGGGRCRLHGGKSTGARTAAGLARCRTASLVHGDRTADIIELRSSTARSSRALRVLARAARAAAKPRSERATPCPASASEWTTTKFPARNPARTAPRRAAAA